VRRLLRPDNLTLLAIAAGKIALHLPFLARYGYFRDELYYIACSQHLAWGYVDQPPLSLALLALVRAVAGDSMVAIRLPVVLAGAAAVVLTGLTARRLGGGRWAQALAALAVALEPVVLGNAGRSYSMNAFDLLFWAWAAYVLVVVLEEERPRLWLLFGVVTGLGLLNKYSMLFLGFGTVVGLAATRARRELARRELWLAGAIAVALFAPHLAWQATHGWPSLEFMRAASQEKNIAVPPLELFVRQPFETGFAQAALWLTGLAWFAFAPAARRLRTFAWIYPVVFAVMATQGAKPYYLTPIYFPYLAAGAVAFESVTRTSWRWALRPAFAVALVALSAIAIPFAIPALPVDRFIAYSQALGMAPRADEHQALEQLPQYYADQFGWRELAAQVVATYQGLAPEEREHAAIYVRNYGEAAAIDFFGRDAGLPPVLCAHNSYWFWGRGERKPKVAIIMGISRDVEESRADLAAPGRCGEVELAGVTDCAHCMPYERGRPLFVCRDLGFTFQEIWEHEREFI